MHNIEPSVTVIIAANVVGAALKFHKSYIFEQFIVCTLHASPSVVHYFDLFATYPLQLL